MDPQATFQQLLEALCAHEWERVDELSETLIGWLSKNGFPPTTLGDPTLGKKWHRSIATFVCYAAQSHARKVKDRQRKREAT
jgi:hypothetical protein